MWVVSGVKKKKKDSQKSILFWPGLQDLQTPLIFLIVLFFIKLHQLPLNQYGRDCIYSSKKLICSVASTSGGTARLSKTSCLLMSLINLTHFWNFSFSGLYLYHLLWFLCSSSLVSLLNIGFEFLFYKKTVFILYTNVTIEISKNLCTYTDFSAKYSVRYLLLLYGKYIEDTYSFFCDSTIFKTPMFSLSLPLLILPIKCKSNYIDHLFLLLNHEKKVLV